LDDITGGDPNRSLCDEGADRVTLHIRETEVAALVFICQPGVIHSQTVQYRGVEIVHIHWVFYDVVAVVVGLTVGDAGLDPTACHPHAEAPGMMIAPVVFFRQRALGIDRAAEFTAP